MLASTGLEAMKEQRLGPEIAHVCFIEVGGSVVGILSLESIASKAAKPVTNFTWSARKLDVRTCTCHVCAWYESPLMHMLETY